MRENHFQAKLIKELKLRFPGCMVLKNDTGYLQGVPDLLILFGDRWAALEVKANRHASRRPNQTYYIKMLDQMSFAAFVYPENLEEVLYDLQQTFRSNRETCLPGRE